MRCHARGVDARTSNVPMNSSTQKWHITQNMQYPPHYMSSCLHSTEPFMVYPRGSVVVQSKIQHGLVCGCIQGHPFVYPHVPGLNSSLAIPMVTKWFFINDTVVSPAYRGKGIGTLLAKSMIDLAKGLGYPRLALIAVNGSESFWLRFGFRMDSSILPDTVKQNLQTYGNRAVIMIHVNEE